MPRCSRVPSSCDRAATILGRVLDRYSNFFLASAGASAAFIGLLFVSLTIVDTEESDQRARANRDALAGSAFAQLINAFFVSMGGLTDEVRIFAGLAAIIGVYLVGTLYSASLASVFQPGGAESTPIRVPPLIEIYDLAKYPLGLLVAAVFGLVPTLVIDRLQRLADSYKEDIKRTEPATSSPTPTI